MQAKAGSRPGRKFGGGVLALTAALAASMLSGCNMMDDAVVHRGYIFDEQTMAQVRAGAAAEQVLILLGTPTTTSTVGGDAWYYINQKAERAMPFLPQKVTDQHVYAVYFDKVKKVTRTANYGLEDGKVVDFSSRETVTGGGESKLLKTLFDQFGKFQMKF
jgi:outer membrane protein assembly factor BamE (lipoprotein component of BamABCDE complex)